MQENAPGAEPSVTAAEDETVASDPSLRGESPPRQENALPERPPAGALGGETRGSAGVSVLAVFFGTVAGLFGSVSLLMQALTARGTLEVLYQDSAGHPEDALCSRARTPCPEALTPTERLVAGAKVTGLGLRSFEEPAGAYSEHLHSSRPSSDVRGTYRGAVPATGELSCWRHLLDAFNPSSFLRPRLYCGLIARPGTSGPERSVLTASSALRPRSGGGQPVLRLQNRYVEGGTH
jgi:hypothetical protein